MSRLFTSSGQSVRASASAPVLLVNIQGRFPLGFIGLISFQSKGLSRVFSSTTVRKHRFFSVQPSLWSNSHMTTGKTIALTIWTFVRKVMSLLFNTLSRFVTAFLPRSKCLLLSMPLLLYFSAWHLLTLGIRWSLYLFIVCLLFQKASSMRWGFFMPSP